MKEVQIKHVELYTQWHTPPPPPTRLRYRPSRTSLGLWEDAAVFPV